MFESPVTPSSSSSEELLDARKKFEAEKLTRRAALRKFGITSGMAIFGMFAADDLARMVIKKMEQNEATRQIAETVAHEFKNSGIAFAAPQVYVCGASGCSDGQLGFNCGGCPTTPGGPATVGVEGGSCAQCVINACGRCFGVNSEGILSQAGLDCQHRVGDYYCSS